jgi:hypothetical protein
VHDNHKEGTGMNNFVNAPGCDAICNFRLPNRKAPNWSFSRHLPGKPTLVDFALILHPAKNDTRFAEKE